MAVDALEDVGGRLVLGLGGSYMGLTERKDATISNVRRREGRERVRTSRTLQSTVSSRLVNWRDSSSALRFCNGMAMPAASSEARAEGRRESEATRARVAAVLMAGKGT